MVIKCSSMECPACGATLDLEAGRKYIFCSYCGSKVTIDDDDEQVVRHIDEAQIKREETERLIQLKKLEIIEKKRAEAVRIKRFKIIVSVLMGIAAVIFMMIGSETCGTIGLGLFVTIGWMWLWDTIKETDDEDLDFGDKIKLPKGISDYDNKNYVAIEKMFRKAGFTNVTCIPLNDLMVGLIKKPGSVEEITINGEEVSAPGRKKYSPDAAIVISYHSYRSEGF